MVHAYNSIVQGVWRRLPTSHLKKTVFIPVERTGSLHRTYTTEGSRGLMVKCVIHHTMTDQLAHVNGTMSWNQTDL